MKIIIEIAGPIGSGKTYLANAISNKLLSDYGIPTVKLSFASPIKAIVRKKCGLLKSDEIYDIDYAVERCKSIIKYYLGDIANEELVDGLRKAIEERGVRGILQFIGTEIVRNYVDPDYWVKNVINKINELPDNMVIIIDDYRFPNEDLTRFKNYFYGWYSRIYRIGLGLHTTDPSKEIHESEKWFNKLSVDKQFNPRPNIEETLQEIFKDLEEDLLYI